MEATAFAEPYRHWVVDGLIPLEWVSQAAAVVPSKDWPGWIHYDSPFESKKRTSEDVSSLPNAIPSPLAELIGELQSPGMLAYLSDLTEIDDLESDPTLRGGGIHVTDAGGFLDSHLDYARHVEFPEMERRLNLILFLNERWNADWRGELNLYADDGATVVRSIFPQFGRAVIFECSDLSYHGVPVVACPERESRQTLAVYYLAPARAGAVRKRALFVPNRERCK